MNKEIVILNSSPRKNGNHAALTEAFIEEIRNHKCSIIRFDIAFMKIQGCRACEKCFSREKQPCIMDDDYNLIANAVEKADAVVLAAPVYWYTFPAQMKAVIDRFFSFFAAERSFEGKKFALISCCGEDAGAFEGLLIPYRKSIDYLKGERIGEVLLPNVYYEGDVNNTDGVQRVKALAKQIAAECEM